MFYTQIQIYTNTNINIQNKYTNIRSNKSNEKYIYT